METNKKIVILNEDDFNGGTTAMGWSDFLRNLDIEDDKCQSITVWVEVVEIE